MKTEVNKMMPISLDQLEASATYMADRSFRRYGNVLPTLIIINPEAVFLMSAPVKTPMHQEEFVENCKLACIAKGATMTLFVSRTWIRVCGGQPTAPKEPANKPCGTECLLLVGETHGSLTRKELAIFRASDGAFSGFGEPVTIESVVVKSNISEFMPVEPPTPAMRSSAEMLLRQRKVHIQEFVPQVSNVWN